MSSDLVIKTNSIMVKDLPLLTVSRFRLAVTICSTLLKNEYSSTMLLQILGSEFDGLTQDINVTVKAVKKILDKLKVYEHITDYSLSVEKVDKQRYSMTCSYIETKV